MDTSKTSIVLSPSPHWGVLEDRSTILYDLLLALAPAAFLGILNYGFRALLVMMLCIAGGIGARLLLNLIFRHGLRLNDCLYTAYTCLLCSFGFGAGCALWVCMLAGAACALLAAALGTPSDRGIIHPACAA